MGLSDQYEDLPQLVTRRLTDLANGLVDAVRAQPVVAAATIAAGLGVLIGVGLARRSGARPEQVREALDEGLETVTRRVRRGKRGGRMLDYGELVPLAMKLVENPIVRAFVLRKVAQMLAKRMK
jgi:hypothetical protein